MRRSLVPRMVALAVVIVVGVYYIAFDVMQYRVTSQPFPVTVLMPSAGGLYTGADVTYRGVQVGTVTALDLNPGDVAVRVGIDAGQHIPDNGRVRVKELSALGEQYLDLQPTRRSGPDLQAGTVIPAGRVVLPTPIGTTLIDLGTTLNSLNGQDLQTVENFMANAFVGTGSDLRTIIVTGQKLFNALVKAQPETVNLVVDGQKDLQTLEATDTDFGTFSAGLASLTGQLRDSNSDVQALIRNSDAAELQLNPFLASDSAQIAGLVSNLATDAQVSDQYQPEVQAIFQLLPVVSDDLASVASGGQVHGELEVNTADTVCPYVLGSQMPGPTQKVVLPSLSNACPTAAPDMLQRGADSAPSFPEGQGP
jgi:phospholipid/cholesterol/gamma-HCH transport system substrate-binding protein